MKGNEFSKGVESLINPIEVGTIHLVQQLNGLLPKGIQKKIMESSGKKFPQMGFVVEPYSFFLFYEIKDLEKVKNYYLMVLDLLKRKYLTMMNRSTM